MKIIKSIENFDLNESVLTKFVTADPKDIETVEKAGDDAIGDHDTPLRKSVLDVAFSLFSYYTQDADKKAFVQKVMAMDQEGKNKVLNSAKSYCKALRKIQKIEVDEIEPMQESIQMLLGDK